MWAAMVPAWVRVEMMGVKFVVHFSVPLVSVWVVSRVVLEELDLPYPLLVATVEAGVV